MSTFTTPFSNIPADKPDPQFLTTIFGKKGAAYLQVFMVTYLQGYFQQPEGRINNRILGLGVTGFTRIVEIAEHNSGDEIFGEIFNVITNIYANLSC